MLDVAIIGSGPYGISLASHAKEKVLTYEIFGYPMDFWKNKMPPEMFIRTQIEYIGLSDPYDRYTFSNYQKEKQLELSYPVPRSIWVDYASWFAEMTKIKFSKQLVTRVLKANDKFCLLTEMGRQVNARYIIVAIGLTNSEFIPANLQHLPDELISHTSEYTSYDNFSEKRSLY